MLTYNHCLYLGKVQIITEYEKKRKKKLNAAASRLKYKSITITFKLKRFSKESN